MQGEAISEFQSQMESHPDGAIVPSHVLSYLRTLDFDVSGGPRRLERGDA